MVWATVAMASAGFGNGRKSVCRRHLASTPVARDVVAAVEPKKGELTQGRRSRQRWPTFVEVEVRGAKLLVATVNPLHLEWSVGVVNWLLKQLVVDATTVDGEISSKERPAKQKKRIDEMALAMCSSNSDVRYAPSRRAFFAKSDELETKRVLCDPSKDV